METCCPNSVLIIREAMREELPRLVEMGQHFREGSRYERFLADNPAVMLSLGEKLLPANGLIVAEKDGQLVGMLGFVIYDHFISGEKVVGEVFWWVEPAYRKYGVKLMREMERRGRLAGATVEQMVSPSAKVSEFYERIGFEWVESTYQRAL